MENNIFKIENNILTEYTGSSERVEIPSGVEKIGQRVFYGNRSIKSVIFPDSLEVIGESAFMSAVNLENIVWGKGLKVIENHAFANCSAITELNIPMGVQAIEQSAFSPCASLSSLILPESLTVLGEFAFSCCKRLKEVQFPNSLAQIQRSAFSMCSMLKSVILPANLKALVRGVFLGCYSLREITLGSQLSSVENNAFQGCTKLLNIHVDSENPFFKDVDGVLFSRDGRKLCYFPGGRLEIIIPDNVTEIGAEAFYENRNFDRIKLPSSLIAIGGNAFYRCTELEGIDFPNGLKSIGKCAFEGCKLIKNIYIPDSVTTIYESAFRSCKELMWLRLPESLGFDLHWFSAPNDPPCFSADHTIIPFTTTRSFSDITSDIGKRRAAMGLILAENAGIPIDTYLQASYIDYIRANISAYYDEMLADDSIIKWFVGHRLIPEDDIERLLEKASNLGRASAAAILLDYQSSLRVRIQAAPKIQLEDRFDALENALDDLF